MEAWIDLLQRKKNVFGAFDYEDVDQAELVDSVIGDIFKQNEKEKVFS